MSAPRFQRIVYLSGGVGGARLLDGVARTVAPETSTACPDVAAVRSNDSCGDLPLRRSSRSRWR